MRYVAKILKWLRRTMSHERDIFNAANVQVTVHLTARMDIRLPSLYGVPYADRIPLRPPIAAGASLVSNIINDFSAGISMTMCVVVVDVGFRPNHALERVPRFLVSMYLGPQI